MIDVTNLKELREQRQTVHMGEMPHDDASSVILLTDGGDETENNENDGTEDNEDSGTESDGETEVLYLDLEGLFLDVLGLRVDLNEVVLDVSAISGSGNLLGNLLSAVAGLFDSRLSDVFDGVLPDHILPDELLSEMDLADRIPSLSDVVFGLVNLLLDMVLDALEDGETTEESSSDTQQS